MKITILQEERCKNCDEFSIFYEKVNPVPKQILKS